MYTRCPRCRTVFRVTQAQLEARAGLVRCGKCAAVFRADFHLSLTVPERPPADAPTPARAEPTPEKIPTPTPTPAPAHDTATPAVVPAPDAAQTVPEDVDATIPTVSDIPPWSRTRRERISPLLWGLGSLALVISLVGQFIFVFRNELAAAPALRPAVAGLCGWLACQWAPPRPPVADLGQTTISPHPQYGNALRIRAVVLNQTQIRKPLPLLEVSLTDTNGMLLARRAFQPSEYGASGKAIATGLAPHATTEAVLDVTNPDGKAAGFEVRLYAPPAAARKQ